ncbi:unnamed protein product [Gongylonema pulchrum]|uniref:Uncharacterized protein n=1 Tax=Gongylonema pulchrum TaxID=637853 RepID=A0A3P6SZQ2_9BILA|nr:unnamed protein product [Gongylonema pulchrum]
MHLCASSGIFIVEYCFQEVHGVVEDLSLRLGTTGDKWLQSAVKKPKYFEFTPMELYAITERMKLAEPTTNGDGKADVANYVEFLHKVRNLKVRGARGCIGSSNITWNSLSFSLRACKNILALWVCFLFQFFSFMCNSWSTVQREQC